MIFGVKPVSFMSLSGSWMSGDGVPRQFPAGLRVLVVDDDPTCLRILEKMLKNCLYEVTTCNRAEVALRFLRNNKNVCDIVISDVHMPDMDGFKLLEHVGLEMDLPVIMMSVDDSKNVVMKGVTHGACDYLIKPVRMEALKNIWQHVVRKMKHEWKGTGSVDDGERQHKYCDLDYSSSANEENWRKSKRRKGEDDEMEDRDDSSTLKKPRVVWSVELHQQFVTAVNQLGIDKAVPKKILELMNVPGLTRENVASHLQKYRLYLRRLSGVSPHQNGFGNPFSGPPDMPFGSISSLHVIDLQALAGSGQLPLQSLAVIQETHPGRVTTKSSIPAPLIDQRDLFNFDSPKLKTTEVQQQQQQNTTANQVNLLHGIPTNMDSKQLAALQRSTQSSGNMNLQMCQTHSVTRILNETSRSHVLDLPSSRGQPILLIPSAVLNHDGIDNVHGPANLEFSGGQNAKFPGCSSSSRASNSSSSLTSRLHNEVNSQTKGSNAYLSHYFQDLCTNKIRSTWGVSEQGYLNVLPPVYRQYSSNQKSGNTQTIGQQINTSSVNNLLSKAERLPDIGFQNGLVPENLDQEDPMSALLKPQQEDIGPAGGKLGFDGVSFD